MKPYSPRYVLPILLGILFGDCFFRAPKDTLRGIVGLAIGIGIGVSSVVLILYVFYALAEDNWLPFRRNR